MTWWYPTDPLFLAICAALVGWAAVRLSGRSAVARKRLAVESLNADRDAERADLERAVVKKDKDLLPQFTSTATEGERRRWELANAGQADLARRLALIDVEVAKLTRDLDQDSAAGSRGASQGSTARRTSWK